VQEIVNSIHARPLQHRLFKHLLDKIDALYGDLILHTEVHWLSREAILFRFQELLPAVTEFLQDRGDLPPQLKDSWWLLDLAFLTNLNTKLNDLSTELQGKNRTIIKMVGIIDSFKGELKLWKTHLVKGVLTHSPNV
jgi:hypothetical protein